MEIPLLSELYFKSLAETDRQARVDMQTQAIEYMLHWQLMIGIVEIPRGMVFNPRKIESWDSRLGMFAVKWGPQFIVPAGR